jgi:hypothetical protein
MIRALKSAARWLASAMISMRYPTALLPCPLALLASRAVAGASATTGSSMPK